MPNTPVLQAFIAQLMPLAQRFGVTTIVIAAMDPKSAEIGIYGSVEAMSVVRDAVEAKFVEKLGVVGGETSWNDV